MVYAIVRAGGHQEKVSVGDIITVNRMKAAAGDTVELAAVLHVDGDTVTHDADALAKVTNPDGSVTGLIFDVHKYLDSDNSCVP